MQKYIEQIHKLRTLSGNAQLDYLKSIKSRAIKEILDYTYNPDKKYKIDKGKLSRVIIHKGLLPRILKDTLTSEDWTTFTNMLDNLADKRAANDQDVYKMKDFITSFKDPRISNFLGMILYKDLRLNLGIKKIQMVWDDFCEAPQVQLADTYDKEKFNNKFSNILYSRKFDGERMYIMDGIAYSRTNKKRKIAPIRHIINEIQDICADTTFDGELLYFNPDGTEDFKKAVSLISSDTRTPECDQLYYVIFDGLPSQLFRGKIASIDFQTEYNILLNMLKAEENSSFGYSVLSTKYPHILLARQVRNPEKLEYLADLYGWEGLMMRNADTPYQYKRTSNLLKIKHMQDGEFEIHSMYEGNGKNKGRLGGITIKYKNSFVRVGGGYTDVERQLLWEHKSYILSDVFKNRYKLKVQYFQESQNKRGEYSLRHPEYLCFRDIKTQEEYTVEQVLSP